MLIAPLACASLMEGTVMHPITSQVNCLEMKTHLIKKLPGSDIECILLPMPFTLCTVL
jgi:hypothetical protein